MQTFFQGSADRHQENNMNFPVDRMIDNVQSKTAAVSKNVGKDTRTLDQKVIDIVASANKMALPDRQVVPRNTLIVMQRAMNELSSLSDESKEAGVLREVNKFISLNQNTFSNSDAYTKHTDLLPAGHPLSDHNSSLSTEDYLQRYAAWLSADPGISDDVRHLVAAAYSQLPGSPQREHAFIRLNTIKASSLPAYFKIDIPALVAAFSFGDGNSSAARRARVKLQWRDRLGRWVEMGRGINFKFRLPDGGVATAAGTYVGSDANAGYSGNWARKEANNGLVEIKGDTNIPDGIYSINNGNAESFKARLSKSDLKRAGVDTPKNSRYRLSSKFDESIPDLSDLLATKVDAPSGWTKNEDGSFTSDDDYKAVKKDDGYEVYRLDPEGNTGDKIGDAKTWADVQNVAAADEEAYDKYKEDVESGQLPLGDGERPEPRYSRMNREVQQEIKQLRDQIPQNEESNKRIEDQLERALSGKDSQGRDLPEGWYSKIDPNEISETYYKDIPGATRKDEYLVATVGREGKINYGTGGFWFNNARPTESWDQITEDTPKIIDQINQGRASIGLAPIEPVQDKPAVSDKEIFDRRMAGESLQEVADSLGIPREEVRAREAKYARTLENPGDGPDEPPTPPSGGLPPKSPAPSNPAAPALFREFDVPAGAFQLRTVEYEPEGRIDEKSTDFTDDPAKIATRYPLDTLVRAFTRSLIGDVDENVIEDIVDINDDGDGNLPDLSEVGDVLENNLPINVPRGERPRASGAGSLEFNAGSEFVQAESLYNAVWLAGGDPNRVIANAYDAVNGNRDNLNKLLEAQGGVPTPKEEKLIVDIIDEIKQIDDATPEEEKPITNADTGIDEDDMEFPGGLIENVPVDFNNPDYYDMDLSPYISTILEPDELGYTDNPKYIAIMVKSSSDLIQQMKSGITDGTGMALVRFNDDSTSEVPVEAIRDALQYQGINTNDILFKLRDESNDMSEEEPLPTDLQAHSQKIKDLIEQAGGTVDDETADKIRDAINQKGLVDWSEADDAEIIEAITEVAGPGILEQALAELAPETPALVLDYPGPRKKGYSSENTTLDLNGNVVGEGSTVQAVTDGKVGKVLKIQDSPAYLRIEFTDGTVAVRSANKIVAVSNKDGSKPSKPSAAAAPSEIQRDPVEISRRLDTPVAKAPAVARSGDIYGVNDESTVPDSIKELTQVNVVQKDFAQWGVRDAEIAKAATGRVAIEPLYELVANYVKDTKKTGDDKPSRDELAAANSKVQEIIADTFGDRTGVSFGSKFYTVTRYGTGYFSSDLVTEDDNVGKIKFEYSGAIRNESGNRVGSVTRSVTVEKIKNQDGTFSYKIKPYNSYMKVDSKANQKTGFASAYNRYMENWYIANNTEQVRVFAAAGAGFEGGFVWALNGFDWDLSRNDSVSEIKYALSRLRRESETVYEKAVADIIINRFKDAFDPVTQKYDASRVPTPMDVALAGWREGSTNWPGRKAMLDTGWHGVKNLVPSAREQVQAINYRKIKNAERRVKTGQNKPNLSSATLSYLNSNEFQTEYAALGTSMDIIRSVLRNNESLATLSESDKVKLNNMVTKEIFSKDSKIPTDDIYRLRTALIKEYSADYSSTDPFSTVGEALTKFSVQQFEDGSELEAAGFKVEGLSDAQGAGINQTYRVTHRDSGQVFYVKDDSTTRDRINEQRDSKNSDELNYPTIVAELEASVLFNLSGLLGTYSTRASTTDENLIVMSSAGATLPTYESPINASDMFSLGLNTPSGQKRYNIDSRKLVDDLKSPEDIFRVHIVDALMTNMDRHSGNWKVAIDLIDNKILVFPVDNTLTDLNVNDALALAETKEFLDYGRAGSALYKDTIPAIIDRAGQERAYEVYKNEVQRMIDNIDDPLVAPKENELAFLISKWGSYDAFKDSMKKRLSAMIEDGTEVNTSLRRIFNRRRGI